MIQSTVADTCQLTMVRLMEYRKRHNLHYKMVNQIHDAVILEFPEKELEATKVAFQETMANIVIPIPNRPLTLGIDITVMDRWGSKYKEKK